MRKLRLKAPASLVADWVTVKRQLPLLPLHFWQIPATAFCISDCAAAFGFLLFEQLSGQLLACVARNAPKSGIALIELSLKNGLVFRENGIKVRVLRDAFECDVGHRFALERRQHGKRSVRRRTTALGWGSSPRRFRKLAGAKWRQAAGIHTQPGSSGISHMVVGCQEPQLVQVIFRGEQPLPGDRD